MARQRALDGEKGNLWVVAREQTRGKGRRGRAWASPRGNLYASALLIDPSAAAVAAQIGFVAGVALRNAVGDLGAGPEVKLKWPNDLVWRGAKLAGLLVEGAALADRRLACIVGIGVNCQNAPEGLAYPTEHLSNALARPVTPDDLFARLAPRFVEALAVWGGGANFAAIRSQWLQCAAGLGEPIKIAGSLGFREGVFETLDAQGRLVLRGPKGIETIEAGDLFLTKDGVGG